MPFVTPRHGYYLGPLGRLVLVRGPDEGHLAAPDLGVTVHKLLSGKVRTQRPPFSPRTYSLPWAVMSDAAKAWLEQCALGYVPGPLYWVDPLVRNQLPPHLSVPSSLLEDVALTYGTVTYSATSSQGFGRFTWTQPAMASPAEQYLHQAAAAATPAVPGLTVTASAYVSRVSGGSAATPANVYLNSYDTAGALISSVAGSVVALATLGATYRVSVTYTLPANAVTAQIFVGVLPHATLSTTLAVDGLQVEYGDLSPFLPGPGLAKVAILSYTPDVYLSGMTNVAMTMQEVR